MEIPIAGEHENRSNRERTAAALRPGGCRRGLAAGGWCRRRGRDRTTSTGWRRRQHRPGGQTARTEKRCLIALLRLGLPVEVPLPEHRAEVGIDRDEIVGGGRDKRQFLETSIGDGALENERAEQRIDGPLLRVDLHLPQQPQVVERLFRDLRFIALPAVTQVAAAVRHPLGASEWHDHDACDEYGPRDQSSHEAVLNAERDSSSAVTILRQSGGSKRQMSVLHPETPAVVCFEHHHDNQRRSWATKTRSHEEEKTFWTNNQGSARPWDIRESTGGFIEAKPCLLRVFVANDAADCPA